MMDLSKFAFSKKKNIEWCIFFYYIFFLNFLFAIVLSFLPNGVYVKDKPMKVENLGELMKSD